MELSSKSSGQIQIVLEDGENGLITYSLGMAGIVVGEVNWAEDDSIDVISSIKMKIEKYSDEDSPND